MRYAVISDIHSNYPALRAVLDDAAKRNIDCYLLAGDYINDFHYTNDVIDTIRCLPDYRAVAGNREEYLLAMDGQNESDWVYEQFAALYYTYRTITPENRSWIYSLPKEKVIRTPDGRSIRLMHMSGELPFLTYGKDVRGRTISNRFPDRIPSRAEVKEYIEGIISESEAVHRELTRLKEDIVICGHTHIQFYVEIENKLVINPGGCGMPCDMSLGAPYSILQCLDGKNTVEEYQVNYDIEEFGREMRESPMYSEAKIWNELSYNCTVSRREIMTEFFVIADKITEEHGITQRPYPNEIFREAYEMWRNIYVPEIPD